MLRKFLLTALLASAGWMASAEAAGLFTLSRQGFAEAGQYTVGFDSSTAFQMQIGDAIDLTLPEPTAYRAVLDRIETHPNGDLTWIGHLQGESDIYRVFVTRGSGGLYGQVLTPKGQYRISTPAGNRFAADEAELTDVKASGMQRFIPLINDGRPIPAGKVAASAAISVGGITAPTAPLVAPSAPVSMANSVADTNTVIDIMVLYTPDLVTRYGSAQTLVNNLVALSNQAYIDSKVAITLRAVAIQQVNYTVLNDNGDALDALTDSTDSAFANVSSLRAQYGADLVSLVRPFDQTTAGSCGVGWVSGGGGRTIITDGSYGFSVVSYGKDTHGSSYYCDNYTFTHELGHNMGSAHDRANSSSSGAYSYSYGYGIEGTFGTIMSYINPTIGKFSSPLLDCKGTPCGIAAGKSNSADNAQSLNNTRTFIASFRAAASGSVTVTTPASTPTADADRVFNWAQATFPTYVSPATSVSLTSGNLYYRFYTTTLTYLGASNGRLYFYPSIRSAPIDLGTVSSYLDVAGKAGF